MKVWIVIPAYNERFSLAGILDELKSKNFSILVVDDGSIDNTFEVAKKKADFVIRNEKNLGKGMSLKKGIDYLLKETNFDYLITMDADGQHSPLDLDKFLEKAEDGAHFIVGNRMLNPIGMPKSRIITNRFMSWLISRIARQRISDTQCGFRLVKREVLEKVKIETSNFEIESEILIKAARLGFLIESVPIRSIYFKRLHSRINPLIDTLRFVRFILRLEKK
ncbi:MAG: glycosyltransferase family 2 protein [Candidatus Omnitrophica bacterium]|nr:glycosyltransferase family 2 protein [Candidatus Omnitrophota bacterium]